MWPEEIQGQHVEQQVVEIAMQKTGGQHTKILFAALLLIRIVDEFAAHFHVVECSVRQQTSEADNQIGNHGLFHHGAKRMVVFLL